MTDDFAPEWRRWASAMVPVRDLVRKELKGCTPGQLRKARVTVAEAPIFAGLGPRAVPPEDRGRWIAARVRERLNQLAESRHPISPIGTRAIRCWAVFIDEGRTPIEIYHEHRDLLPQREATDSPAARRGRVHSLMWAGGAHGDKDSIDGLQLIAAELRSALSTDLPEGTVMDVTTLDYEWRRLGQVRPEGCDLLQALARLAPGEPLPQALLRAAGDCLPGLIPDICAQPDRLRATLTELRGRGLVELKRDSVHIAARIAPLMVDRATAAQNLRWTSAMLRFLTSALPDDTHSVRSWDLWQAGYPHVLALCAAGERDQVNLGDVAYLLDRASVYAREGLEDADVAIALGERALEVSLSMDSNDPVLHSDCAGNLALAYRLANRFEDALVVSGRGLQELAAAIGEKTEAYAESLNVHGSLLASIGRRNDAERAHALAIAILDELGGEEPTGSIRALLIEALNDHAVQLLEVRHRPGATRAGRVEQAKRQLIRASRLMKQHDYGWTQIELNLGLLSHETGDLGAARTHLEAVRDYCRESMPGPSTTAIAALKALSEVYQDLGLPNAQTILREARRLDDELAPAAKRPPRQGRTR